LAGDPVSFVANEPGHEAGGAGSLFATSSQSNFTSVQEAIRSSHPRRTNQTTIDERQQRRSARQLGERTGQASRQNSIDVFDFGEQRFADQPEGASDFANVERTDQCANE
jgi:hypothetical protein